jgi:hypothetical protein
MWSPIQSVPAAHKEEWTDFKISIRGREEVGQGNLVTYAWCKIYMAECEGWKGTKLWAMGVGEVVVPLHERQIGLVLGRWDWKVIDDVNCIPKAHHLPQLPSTIRPPVKLPQLTEAPPSHPFWVPITIKDNINQQRLSELLTTVNVISEMLTFSCQPLAHSASTQRMKEISGPVRTVGNTWDSDSASEKLRVLVSHVWNTFHKQHCPAYWVAEVCHRDKHTSRIPTHTLHR